MAEETATISIGGAEYVIVTADTWSLDEGVILFDYSGLTLDQFEENPLNPKALKALLHISVARKQPALAFDTVRDLVGTVTYSDIVAALVTEEEDDAVPPALTPNEQSSGVSEKPTASGVSGTNGSSTVQDVSRPAPTGGPDSPSVMLAPTPSEVSPLGS